ncbi:MAG: N-acetylmuramoyl-L-alanine amidase [Bacteroidia bacterium]|nr:N-acetylmuramoyl-L-alanine amidase [Bacteroidia bacterium]
MERWFVKILGLLGLVGISCLNTSFISYPRKGGSFLVVLDPGHGGKDPGALGKTIYEKVVALKVGLAVEKLFKENEPTIKIDMTRRTDVFVELHERAAIANRQKADLFVSIHCNANPSPAISGSETYAMGTHKEDANLDVMMAENASILLEENYQEKYEGFDPKSEESYIMFSLVQNAYLRQSLNLAARIEKEFSTKRQSRGVKQAGFLVLWKSTMPSVLVELGFLSNKDDEKFLASEEGQQFLANSLYRAIKSYRDDEGNLKIESKGIKETPKEMPKELPKETPKKDIPKSHSQSSNSHSSTKSTTSTKLTASAKSTTYAKKATSSRK